MNVISGSQQIETYRRPQAPLFRRVRDPEYTSLRFPSLCRPAGPSERELCTARERQVWALAHPASLNPILWRAWVLIEKGHSTLYMTSMDSDGFRCFQYRKPRAHSHESIVRRRWLYPASSALGYKTPVVNKSVVKAPAQPTTKK